MKLPLSLRQIVQNYGYQDPVRGIVLKQRMIIKFSIVIKVHSGEGHHSIYR